MSLFISLNKFFFSDPYVKVDLNTINGDETIDSVLTKTKKKVNFTAIDNYCKYLR